MVGMLRKLALAGVGAVLLMVTLPAQSSATVTGGCTVSGVATAPGVSTASKTDLTSASEWHLMTNEQVNGTADYPEQTYVHIFVDLFGIPVPIYSSSGRDTHGSAGPFYVSDYSRFTRVFAATGTSDTCSGSVLIIVDDQSPYTNIGGIVGLVLFVVGIIGLLLVMFGGKGGCGSFFLGALLGLMLGVGAAVTGAEVGVIDPRNYLGLAVIGLGILIGVVLAWMRGRSIAAP